MTQTEWGKVIFSDESRLFIHKSDGRVYVRRMSGEEFKEACIQTTVKHEGGDHGLGVYLCQRC